MKNLVCVKRVVDYNVKVQAKSDGSGLFTALPELVIALQVECGSA